ncbi:MAG: (Fe-S)-binding protein [Siculibacillus sp.]|nr:(Fe-S)-binding protein [Siculibacillus sp.]
MTDTINVQAAADKFLALVGRPLATWAEACVRCGLCAEACHFYQATKDPKYTPAWKILPIAKAHRARTGFLGMLGLAPKITEKDLKDWEELIYDSCNMCGRCTLVCPMGIDIATITGATRQAMAAAGIGPADLFAAADNARDRGSPLGLSSEKLVDRLEWLADDNEIDLPLDKKGAEVLLTVSSIEMMKYPDSIVSMGKLLNAAGVDWTFSSKGYEATNFGYLAGKSDIAKMLTMRIVEAAEALGVKTVIIPECGHAYGVMRWQAANVIGRPLPFEVFHITEYLAKLKREGKLEFKPFDKAFTYHDPCQISRRGGAAGDARYLLEGFAPNFKEMSPTANSNWCCGGGGGVQAIARSAPIRYEVFKIKTRQVEETGTSTLMSSCANCRLTLDEAKTATKWGGELASIVEVLAEHLVEKD